MGTSALTTCKRQGAHRQYDNAFLRERSSIFANLMSTRLAFSMSLHTPFVRLPVERTKAVTMRAPWMDLNCLCFLSVWNWELAWVRCRAESQQGALQFPQSSTPLIKVLDCSLKKMTTSLLVGLWRTGDVGGYCLGFLIWRTDWEMSEMGELERREFHVEGIVGGFEEEFVGGLSGGFFQWGWWWGARRWDLCRELLLCDFRC